MIIICMFFFLFNWLTKNLPLCKLFFMSNEVFIENNYLFFRIRILKIVYCVKSVSDHYVISCNVVNDYLL